MRLKLYIEKSSYPTYPASCETCLVVDLISHPGVEELYENMGTVSPEGPAISTDQYGNTIPLHMDGFTRPIRYTYGYDVLNQLETYMDPYSPWTFAVKQFLMAVQPHHVFLYWY